MSSPGRGVGADDRVDDHGQRTDNWKASKHLPEEPPAVWHQQPDAGGQQLEQVWSAGVHCDVGGGYAESDLADIALWWLAPIRPYSRPIGATDPQHELVASTAIERRDKGGYEPSGLTTHLRGAAETLQL